MVQLLRTFWRIQQEVRPACVLLDKQIAVCLSLTQQIARKHSGQVND